VQLTRQQEFNYMLSGAEEIQLLQNTVRAIGAKKTLDIGSYLIVVHIIYLFYLT